MKAKYLLKVNDKDTWICTFVVDSWGEITIMPQTCSGYKKNSLEMKIFKHEMRFHNSSGLHSCSKHILLCGYIISGTNTIQCQQVTNNKMK